MQNYIVESMVKLCSSSTRRTNTNRQTQGILQYSSWTDDLIQMMGSKLKSCTISMVGYNCECGGLFEEQFTNSSVIYQRSSASLRMNSVNSILSTKSTVPCFSSTTLRSVQWLADHQSVSQINYLNSLTIYTKFNLNIFETRLLVMDRDCLEDWNVISWHVLYFVCNIDYKIKTSTLRSEFCN